MMDVLDINAESNIYREIDKITNKRNVRDRDIYFNLRMLLFALNKEGRIIFKNE